MTPDDLDKLIKARQLPPLPTERLKEIESAVMSDLTPVRPLASKSFYVAALAGIFLAVWIVGCILMGQAGWRAESLWQRIAVFTPLFVTVALLLASLERQMTPGAKYIRPTGISAASAFILLLAMIALIFSPASETEFVRSGLVCFKTGLVFALPAAILFVPLLRRGARLTPALTGAAAGGLAGLAGLAVLEIQCSNLNVFHIVVWHVSVTLVCVVGGLILSSVTFRRWSSNNQPSGG
jgi:hypothetical protein